MAYPNIARCLTSSGQHSKFVGIHRGEEVVELASIQFKLFRSPRLLKSSAVVSAALGAKANSTTEDTDDHVHRAARSSTTVYASDIDLIEAIHSDEVRRSENRILSAWAQNKDLFVGRVAKFGVAAALVMELITGQGPVSNIGLLELDQAILFLLGFILVAALVPTNKGVLPAQKNLTRPKSMLDINQAGVCRENELALGRMSQLGLAAVLIGEAVTGKGILAHMEIQTGVPLCDTDPLVIIFITFILLSAISPGNRKLD